MPTGASPRRRRRTRMRRRPTSLSSKKRYDRDLRRRKARAMRSPAPAPIRCKGAVPMNTEIMPERVFLTERQSGKAEAAGAARMELTLQ